MTAATIDAQAYRTAFDFHNDALKRLDRMGIDEYWQWFWNAAKPVYDAANSDFLRDSIINIALDIERRQRACQAV